MNNLNQKNLNVKFYLPNEYASDMWDITKLDCYLNKTSRLKHYWNNRFKDTNGMINFSIIHKYSIREEIKYCLYTLCKPIDLAVISNIYHCYLPFLATFINKSKYTSLIEIDSEQIKRYLRGNINNNKPLSKTRQRNIYTFLNKCKQVINEYLDKTYYTSEYDKDIWDTRNLKGVIDKYKYRFLNFTFIKNEFFKKQIKEYCKYQLNVQKVSTVYCSLNSLKHFIPWLEKEYPNIKYFDVLNRDIIEEFFFWLRTKSKNSSASINTTILNLKKFFDTGKILEFENFPTNNLIINTDYTFRIKRGSKYYTDDELKGICSIIPKFPPLYGRFIYCLMELGCRVNEIIYLQIDSFKQQSDGLYYLEIDQQKTDYTYVKPISNNVARIIQYHIDKNIEKFGDEAKFVFVDDDNQPINYCKLMRIARKTIKENNILDRDGNILHFGTHRFRATFGTNLFKENYDATTVQQLLGQKSSNSLTYYVDVNNKDVLKQIKPRLDRDNYIIENLDNLDNIDINDYPKTLPLCNGYCSKPLELGLCKKLNHCLECNLFVPSIEFLSHYERQLKEVETAINLLKDDGFDLLLEQNLRTKEALEKIIQKITERMNNDV